MSKNTKATITIDQARKLRKAILEGEYSFGVEGQINITIPRYDEGGVEQETNGAWRKYVESLAAQLVEHFHLDPKSVFASKGRIVVKNPNQDMPFIFAELAIPAKWDSFAKVQVSTIPSTRPSGNAVVVGMVTDQAPSTDQIPSAQSVGFAAKFRKNPNPNFRQPTTIVGQMLLRDATATGSGQSIGA